MNPATTRRALTGVVRAQPSLAFLGKNIDQGCSVRCTSQAAYSTSDQTTVSDKRSNRGQLNMVQKNTNTTVRHYGKASGAYRTAWSRAAMDAEKSHISRQKEPTLDLTAADVARRNANEIFDPILDIRAVNPLIFETNYELEEYGPSFGRNVDRHDEIIQEWRIRNESLA